MRERDLAKLIRFALLSGLDARGYSADVWQSNQPRQQALPDGPLVFFFRVSVVNVGWPGRRTEKVAGATVTTTTQRRESRWQIGSMVPQSPGSSGPTAAEYTLAAASVMQHDATIDFLAASDVGVLHVQDIRSTWFQDDRHQFEEHSSFDVVLMHHDIFSVPQPIVSGTDYSIHGV